MKVDEPAPNMGIRPRFIVKFFFVNQSILGGEFLRRYFVRARDGGADSWSGEVEEPFFALCVKFPAFRNS